MKKILLLLFGLSISGIIYAHEPSLEYDIQIHVTEETNLDAKIRIRVAELSADTLRFSFGNALMEYWESSLMVDGCPRYEWDTTDRQKILKIPTDGASEMTLSFRYTFIPFISAVMHSKATLFDNRGYENFLPGLYGEHTLKISQISVSSPAGVECLYPVRVNTVDDFYLLTYRTSDCRDRGRRTIGKLTVDYRLFTDSLAAADRAFLFDRIHAFCRIAQKRLWNPPQLRQPLFIIEMPWIGNTRIGEMLIYHGSSFRTVVLYHELMHLWVDPNLFGPTARGKYFLSETLNEYMMCQYIRAFDAVKYGHLLEEKRQTWAHCSDPIETSLVDVPKYADSNHHYIMDYGVLVLNDFARQVGPNNLQTFIERFLKKSRKRTYDYSDFRKQLLATFGEERCREFLEKIETVAK